MRAGFPIRLLEPDKEDEFEQPAIDWTTSTGAVAESDLIPFENKEWIDSFVDQVRGFFEPGRSEGDREDRS